MPQKIQYTLHFIFGCILLLSIIGIGILTNTFYNINNEKSLNTYKVIDKTDQTQIGNKTYYGEKSLNIDLTCFELSTNEIKTAKAFLLLFWIYLIPYTFYILYLFSK